MKRQLILFIALLTAPLLHGQTLRSGDDLLDKAFQLAVRTVDANTTDSLLKAGAGYGGEWTRDIAINSWNGVSLLRPEIARYSLWSVTTDNRARIGHQYWDKIIWVVAAYNHYLVTGDRVFLHQAYLCSARTMKELEEYAFEHNYGLFMGPAVFQDGIAGYDEPVCDPENESTYVLDHKNASAIKCLSTNCTYYAAYRALAEMSRIEGDGKSADFERKAEALRQSIRKYLYDKKENRLYYLVDHRGVVHRYQEALGIAFAGLDGVVSPSEMSRILDGIHTSDFGVPCVYPHFPRFSDERPGRHNVTIWPFVNAFYADAAWQAGNREIFEFELKNIARLAIEYGPDNFQEVYNMLTGAPDGGWQRGKQWWLNPDQTWSATGYLRLFLLDVFGMRFQEDGVSFQPAGLSSSERITLEGIPYRKALLDITLTGTGSRVARCSINGQRVAKAFVPASATGRIQVEIALE